MRIGINGFGRIGRNVFRIAQEYDGVEVVHINDLTDAPTLASLLQYDTTYGRWQHTVRGENGVLTINGKEVSVTGEKDPSQLPWDDNNVDVVLEATGMFRTRDDAEMHLSAGAKRVLISAPGKGDLDGDFVIGVNERDYNSEQHRVISIGSCTTNCLAPVAKVLHDEFGIQLGLINTVHAYTSSQNLMDGPHKKIRRGRAASENIVPTTTGAAAMIGKIIPDLDGKLNGIAVRVPVKCGSLLDLTCTLEREVDVQQVNAALHQYAEGAMKGILVADDGPLVSSDIIGTQASAIVSTQDTQVMGGHLVKVLAWYDNEWAFSHRCVDMMTRMR